MSLKKRMEVLESSVPKGFTTYDANGEPVIESDLDSMEWYLSAVRLFESRGREAEKKQMRAQLKRSVSSNAGSMHELAAVLYHGPAKRRRNEYRN